MSAVPVASDLTGWRRSFVLRERGYDYPADYLIRIARDGGPLFFANDAEWLAYMEAAGIGNEEDVDA